MKIRQTKWRRNVDAVFVHCPKAFESFCFCYLTKSYFFLLPGRYNWWVQQTLQDWFDVN